MKADCMEEDILKQELVNKVKEARSMGEIIDQVIIHLIIVFHILRVETYFF
jgi:hypothetical protein